MTPRERVLLTIAICVARESRGLDGSLGFMWPDGVWETTLLAVQEHNKDEGGPIPDDDIPGWIERQRESRDHDRESEAEYAAEVGTAAATNVVALPTATPRNGKPPLWFVKYDDLVAWLDRDDCPVTSPSDRLILHTLVNFFNVKEKAGRPGMVTLARRTRLSVTTIRRRLRAMAAAGWIGIDSRGERRANSYRFTFPM